MKKRTFKENTGWRRATMPLSLPFEIHPEERGSKANGAAVLGIHGYTGGPSDFTYLAERLGNAGFGVSVPRLPGAGTDMEDLSTSTRNDWMRRVVDAWQDLSSRYEQIHILGYSMGGLLALELSRIVEAEKTVLLAPALYTVHRLMPLLPLLSPFSRILPPVKTGWEPEDEEDEERREHGRRYWYYRDVKSAAQMALLQGEVIRRMGTISSSVTAIVSSGDKTVPADVLNLLNKRLPRGLSDSLTVENSGHNIPQGPDRTEVADTVISWLKGK